MWAVVLAGARVWIAEFSTTPSVGDSNNNVNISSSSINDDTLHSRRQQQPQLHQNKSTSKSHPRGVSPAARAAAAGVDEKDSFRLIGASHSLDERNVSTYSSSSKLLRSAIVSAFQDARKTTNASPKLVVCSTPALLRGARGAFTEASRTKSNITSPSTLHTSTLPEEQLEALAVAATAVAVLGLPSRDGSDSSAVELCRLLTATLPADHTFGDSTNGSLLVLARAPRLRRVGAGVSLLIRQLLSGPAMVVLVSFVALVLFLSSNSTPRFFSSSSSDLDASSALRSQERTGQWSVARELKTAGALRALINDHVISEPAFEVLYDALIATERTGKMPLTIALIAATTTRGIANENRLNRVISAIRTARCGTSPGCETMLHNDLDSATTRATIAAKLAVIDHPVFVVPVGFTAPQHVDVFTAAWDDSLPQVTSGDRTTSTARGTFVLTVDAAVLGEGGKTNVFTTLVDAASQSGRRSVLSGNTDLDSLLKGALKDAGWPDRVCQRIRYALVV